MSPEKTLPNRVFMEDVPSTVSSMFRVDRKPDWSNWSFKSLYKMHIAKYKRLGNVCIGRHKNKVVYLDDKSKKHHRQSLRYFSKDNRKDVYFKATISSTVQNDREKSVKYTPLFILLAEDKDVSVSSVNPLGIYDAGTEQYLKGRGLEVQDIPLPVDTRDEYIRGRTADFNSRLKANPQDISLWLQFVDFQDETSNFQRLERSKDEHDYKKKADSSLWEIKAAILEKALEKNPGCISLKLAHLDLAEEQFADTEDLKKRWRNVVFTHTNHPIVWAR